MSDQATESRVARKIICLTPCRDEAWVMDTFLSAASLWADHIIVGDQMSTDGTREIVARYPKAILVDNLGEGYDEGERHRVVFERAREIPGENLLLALDADEVLSANWMTSPEWDELKTLPVGTAVYGEWENLESDFEGCFPLGGPFIIGYVDDGIIGHSPGKFHVPRLAASPGAPRYDMKEIRILHYQYTDGARYRSKARNYQVQEWLEKPERPIRLYRRLRPKEAIRRRDIRPVRQEWFQGYSDRGVDVRQVRMDAHYRWDRVVLEGLLDKGPAHFRRLDIWDVDWECLAQDYGVEVSAGGLQDPRNALDKAIMNFLRATQPNMNNPLVRAIQFALRPFGW